MPSSGKVGALRSVAGEIQILIPENNMQNVQYKLFYQIQLVLTDSIRFVISTQFKLDLFQTLSMANLKQSSFNLLPHHVSFFRPLQFVKFANIEEDTPSYHRRYDFFVSQFSAMCHSTHEDPETRSR